MAWIKRNLFFVLGIAAGLGLTVFCACLFAADLRKNTAVSEEYQGDVLRYNQLQSKPLPPSDENIAKAKEDTSRVLAFQDQLRKAFTPFPTPPKENEKGFSAYLENTITELKSKAADAEVVLPATMAFGFTDQLQKLKYPAENIQPWMQQLAEIKALCDILFDAKINSLASLQRVAVSSNDIFTTSADTFPGKIITTSVATITPYKIEFRAFTRELAEVLDGLARSSNCLIINNIEIKPAGLTAGAPSPPFSPPPVIGPGTPTPPARRGPGTAPTRGGATNTPPRGTTPPGERGPGMPPGRNGGGRRRGGMAGLEPAGPIFVAAPVTPPAGRAPPAPAADSGSGAPGTVLREQLLLIMISVEVVKFN